MPARTPLPRILHSDRRDPGTARALQRAYRSGRLHRLRPGSFVRIDQWNALGDADRHRLEARAIAGSLRATAVFSHATAAILYGWPTFGPVPDRIHIVDPAAHGTVHRARLSIHGDGVLQRPSEHTFAGVPVASVIDTAVQVLTTSTVHVAVVTIGHPVRNGWFELDELRRALPQRPARGSVRARLALDALDPAHESVGEDLTELRLRELGFTRIVCQHVFRGDDGIVDRVDFWLPELGVVVEFDGRTKYEDERMLGGRNPRDALWYEKIREDRLRARSDIRTVVRPRWWHLVDVDRLRSLLRQHRVPLP